MFSGIIEYLGTVESINNTKSNYQMAVQISKLKLNVSVGDSVAVNGVCLTIKNIDNDIYKFDLSPETMNITALSELKKNSKVNIELPLTVNKFISGHITTGHIDTLGTLESIEKIKDSWSLRIKINQQYTKYIVQKGSIALDGVSLTVNDINDNIINLMIIPHTYDNTVIKFYNLGQKINIEVDYIAKHLEKLKND